VRNGIVTTGAPLNFIEITKSITGNNGRQGIYLSASAGEGRNCIVEGNLTYNNGVSGIAVGTTPEVSDVPYSIVANNICYREGRDGIYVRCNRLTVQANTIAEAVRHGIYHAKGYDVAYLGNVIYNPGGVGIEVDRHGRVVIEGNLISGAGGRGIDIYRCPEAVIRGNIVRRCGSHGIHVRNDGTTFSHNAVIANNQVLENTGEGIIIEGVNN